MTQISNDKNKYDLEERTAKFAEDILEVCKKTPKTAVTMPLISQLVRSGTSVGANYREANGASSRKDFKNKIYFCKKEAKETSYWLRLLAVSDSQEGDSIKSVIQEALELTLIFSKIAANTN